MPFSFSAGRSDRRKSKRKSVSLQAKVSILLKQDLSEKRSTLNAHVDNIGADGLRVVFTQLDRNSDRDILRDMHENRVEISIPSVLGVDLLAGKIAWVSLADGPPQAGIRLDSTNPRIRELLHHYLSRPNATKYTVGLYKTAWQRRLFPSLFSLLRDMVVFLVPLRVPQPLVKLLYGTQPRFAFYVHPRRKEDVFISLPFLNYLRNILPVKWLVALASALPPFVVGYVVHPNQTGVIIGTQQTPAELLGNVKRSIKKARAAVRFAAKICPPGSILGLGAWWPIVTRRGLALKSAGERYGVTITNGHCGTLVSIYLMVRKISKISGIEMGKLHVGIIGVGKMGQNVAHVLNGTVRKLHLLDVNQKKLANATEKLARLETKTRLETTRVTPTGSEDLRNAFLKNHLLICTASNIGKVLSEPSLPDRFLLIDDSRPEAFYRSDPHSSRVVIEGGLMRLRGAGVNYDFGFGIGEDVFGCLAESYLLSLDKGGALRPTLGNVELDNFWRLIEFCQREHVSVGNFRSGSSLVDDATIAEIVAEKDASIRDPHSQMGKPNRTVART